MPKHRKKTRRKNMKLAISEKKYKQLISQRRSKKKMTSRNKKLLDDALYAKYCKCLKGFGFKKQGYPICMNSVYKNRGFKSPRNASRLCNKILKK